MLPNAKLNKVKASDKMILPYLEHDVVEHCNLRCKWCSHFSPFLKPCFTNVNLFRNDLINLSKNIHVEKFRLIGGEPLLHENLLDLIVITKETKITDKIAICTNGMLVHKISDEIFKNIDILDISFYKDSGLDLNELKYFLKDKVRFKLRIVSNFFEVNTDNKLNEAEVQNNYDNCLWAKCYSFKDGYFYKCCKPIIQNKYFNEVGIKTDVNFKIEDGIKIDQLNFKEELLKYIAKTTPMKSCSYCHSAFGRVDEHKQMSE